MTVDPEDGCGVAEFKVGVEEKQPMQYWGIVAARGTEHHLT